MNTQNPTIRCVTSIAQHIEDGKLFHSKAQMFSIERCGTVLTDMAITLMTKTDSSDRFFIVQAI